jgi:hypothetical protein
MVAEGVMGARVVTVNEVLGGHVKLDIECLDRVYLNAYVPILQSSGQVVAFMTQYLDLPIPSPVHCQSGYRASVAASFLQAAGHAVTIVDDDFGRAAAVLPLTGDASPLRALSAA